MSTKDILDRHNFKHQKKYGQNFLTDYKIPARIASLCTGDPPIAEGEKRESLILEIGPGAGILTKELAKRFSKVIAVEIDEQLIPVLRETLSDFDNVSVIHSDIMKTDLHALLDDNNHIGKGAPLPVSVCANLPYYITTPVIMKLLEEYSGFDCITVMVQKEVARRLCAKPKSEDYGAITAVVNLYGSVKKLFDVSRGSFHPQPKVDSAVIRIDLYKPPKYSDGEIRNASALMKAAFGTRRKTLANSLSSLEGKLKIFKKDELCEIFKNQFNDSNIRGEELCAEEFVLLSKLLF